MPPFDSRMADIRFIGPVTGRYTLKSRKRREGFAAFAARLQSISPLLLVVNAAARGEIGEVVTAYFEPFGTLRGPIVRLIDGGFCVELEGDLSWRRQLAARIEWHKKRVFSGVSDKRAHPRFPPREPRSAVVLHDGTVVPCMVLDLSQSGCVVLAEVVPQIGEPLAVGRIVSRVVRHIDGGFAVRFLELQPRESVEAMLRAPEAWDEAIGRRGITPEELAVLANWVDTDFPSER